MLNFQAFTPLKKSLVINLSETCALISKKYRAEQGKNITSLSKTLRLLWSHSAVFVLGKKA